jgi:heptosyltransferase-2
MKILMRMPNWLGDGVMATPALNNLRRHFADARFTLLASRPVAEMFRVDPAFAAVEIDASKTRRPRLAGIRAEARRLRREHGPFDLAFCFTNSFASKLLVRMTGARRRVAVSRDWTDLLVTDPVRVDQSAHQVELWNQMINGHLGTDYETGPTTLYVPAPHSYPRPTLGVNPGAAYGGAKRWNPRRFAEVAARLADRFDIVIFGGPNETEMAAEIEATLRASGVTNYENLAGRTTIAELLARIAGLRLFVTNDSGPMHIAGAFGVPSVTIFGSTNHEQSRQWRNARSAIVRHEVACAPCMKRVCPLGHHECMEKVHADEVVEAALKLVA